MLYQMLQPFSLSLTLGCVRMYARVFRVDVRKSSGFGRMPQTVDYYQILTMRSCVCTAYELTYPLLW